MLIFIQGCSAQLLASHYISTAYFTVLSVSLHRSHHKTVIKDHNWEWAESGLLWGKLIYLYSVSAGLNTHCFSSHSHFTQTHSLTNTLVFLTPLSGFKFSSISLGRTVSRTALHVLKDAKEEKKKKILPCECFQLWPSVSSEPDNQAARHAAGLFSRDSFTAQLHI